MAQTSAEPRAADPPVPPPVPPPVALSSRDPSLRYMPGLDVLRGLAILMVMLYHGLGSQQEIFGSAASAIARSVPAFFQLGHYGVHLFFVLSGFLITGILLETRGDPDYFRNFYLRRILRIVPAYVLVLAVLRFSGHIDTRYLIVAIFYFCNMSSAFHSQPEYGPLWSLSVEEQVYLVWPLLIRRLSRCSLRWFAIALIALTPLLRFALQYGPPAVRDISYKPWVVCDFFAAGALIAIAVRTPRARPTLLPTAVVAMAAGVLAFAAMHSIPAVLSTNKGILAIELEPWLLFFSGLMMLAFLYPSVAKVSVATRSLVFLANISYGLYLCHQLIFNLIDSHWRINPAESHPILKLITRLAIELVIAIAIAWLSRSTFEAFFLRLKPKHRHAHLPASST